LDLLDGGIEVFIAGGISGGSGGFGGFGVVFGPEDGLVGVKYCSGE